MPAAVGTGEAAASPPPRGADPASTQGPRTFAAFGLVADCGGPDLGRTQAGRGGKCAGGQCETTRRAAPTPRRLLPASSTPPTLGAGREWGCPVTLHSVQALPQAVSGLRLSCSVRRFCENPVPGGSSASPAAVLAGGPPASPVAAMTQSPCAGPAGKGC